MAKAISKRNRIPKQSRTLPRKGNKDRGNGLDDGKYYECWHCGFTCNVDRDSLGGYGNGTYVEDYDVVSGGVHSGDILSGVSVFGGDITHYQTALALDSDGDPETITHSYNALVSQGCPFCGTLNWRGDN